ncbi:Uu.00g092640.m01.CDS01 [Anthostomella pinea]|uniref:Uu.00g092640.m01.CDS01 n=1 Tax=Anthostomella pinea TaxID=933095 RepID=A0AAI8VHV0_9PEZI|nr:Uu.00g092640.m01.CDS01 [Anthostomella pinea]
MAPTDIAKLQEHLAQHPSIKLITREDPDFEAVRACFVKRPAKPSAIARPQSAEDVQALVRYCVGNGVDFNVRAGGHDCAGRSQVHDALTIDLRDLHHVRISDDKTTASVGGGILFRELTKALGEEDLVTPVGTIASVGYVGWAILGGYGPFSTSYGLGADQIVGAKLVDAKGELIDASEELLKGIRGGGGIFGVIVELTVKVYPLKELLTSLLVFKSGDLVKDWTTYTQGFEDLVAKGDFPTTLSLQPFGIEFPGAGKVLAVGATWSSPDHEEGRKWIDKIASELGVCVMNSPAPMSLNAYCEANEKMVAHGSYGRAHTLSFKRFTPKMSEILGRHTELLPGGGIAFCVHMLRAPAASEQSVFGARVQHQMLELISLTPDETLEARGNDWALAVKKDLLEQEPENILESSFVPLLGEDDANYKKVYGPHYETLVRLKKKYDPENVFRHAVPKILG